MRIHDTCIDTASNYKSVLIAPHTSTRDAIDLLLRQQRYVNNKRQYVIVKRKHPTKGYCFLFLVGHINSNADEHLLPLDVPLLSLMETEPAESFELHLRPYSGGHVRTFEHIEEVETPQVMRIEMFH